MAFSRAPAAPVKTKNLKIESEEVYFGEKKLLKQKMFAERGISEKGAAAGALLRISNSTLY